jgi:hypothetical protein
MLRKILRLIMSEERFARMEAESRDWYWTCSSCGHEFSVWDAGGIRYRARGNPTRLVRCPMCETAAMLRLKRRSEEGV